MKHLVTAALVAVAAAALVAAIPADAARMGGGKSFGAQRQSVAPSKPDAPASGTTTNAMPATAPGAGAPTPPAGRRDVSQSGTRLRATSGSPARRNSPPCWPPM